MTDFEEYIRQNEPDSRQKAYAWRTAIGLQAVDGLKPSEYLKDTARKHIEGEIDIDEAQKLIKSYYQSKTARTAVDDDLEEADVVSAHIAKLLGEQSFAFLWWALLLFIVGYLKVFSNLPVEFVIMTSRKRMGTQRRHCAIRQFGRHKKSFGI